MDDIYRQSRGADFTWRHVHEILHVNVSSCEVSDEWWLLFKTQSHQSMRDLQRTIIKADLWFARWSDLWAVYTRHSSLLWVLNLLLTPVCGYAHMHALVLCRVGNYAPLTQVSRWQCETSSHLTLLLPEPFWLPCFSDPTPLADMSTALLHTQPISIELSLTHFAHSLMKQGSRWSAFNEIRVGPAPLNHLSRLKAGGLLTCHCTGYTKPDLHPWSGIPVLICFFFFIFQPSPFYRLSLTSKSFFKMLKKHFGPIGAINALHTVTVGE